MMSWCAECRQRRTRLRWDNGTTFMLSIRIKPSSVDKRSRTSQNSHISGFRRLHFPGKPASIVSLNAMYNWSARPAARIISGEIAPKSSPHSAIASTVLDLTYDLTHSTLLRSLEEAGERHTCMTALTAVAGFRDMASDPRCNLPCLCWIQNLYRGILSLSRNRRGLAILLWSRSPKMPLSGSWSVVTIRSWQPSTSIRHLSKDHAIAEASPSMGAYRDSQWKQDATHQDSMWVPYHRDSRNTSAEEGSPFPAFTAFCCYQMS